MCHKTTLASDTSIDFQINFSYSIGETVTHWFTLIMLSALRHSGKERFYTSARNPVKDILLKLNLPDHRSILTDSKEYIKMDMEVTEHLMARSGTDLKMAKLLASAAICQKWGCIFTFDSDWDEAPQRE
ncbi:hypothetical protein Tco_1003649 [Tanacetum coccineum]|uniref:PIN domain-containing protein n=1 Tax=Tanacetum coccineum TaxID=301880 RepID=A0ABQ5FA19_9ASTR